MRLAGWIGRLGRDRRGAAAVEFALIVPFLIALYLGTVEVASLYTVDRRVATVAGTVGDLVSRVDGTISTSTLNDYFQASSNIIKPYTSTGLTQVVSFLSVAANGTATVVWSRAYNGGTARTANTTFPMTTSSQINQLARGGYLVVAETAYSYKPVFGVMISATLNLRRTEYFLPRFGSAIAVN